MRSSTKTTVTINEYTEFVTCSACDKKGGLMARMVMIVPTRSGTNPIEVETYVHLDCLLNKVRMSSGRIDVLKGQIVIKLKARNDDQGDLEK
jgi:hypothetical protein